jgi:hypothetical protein
VTEVGDGEGVSKKIPATVLAGTYTHAVARPDSFNTLIQESICPKGCSGYRLLLIASGETSGHSSRQSPSPEIQYQYYQEPNILRLAEVETKLAPLGYRLSAIRTDRRNHYGGQWELAAFKGPKNSVPIVAMYDRGFNPLGDAHSKILVYKILFVFPVGE